MTSQTPADATPEERPAVPSAPEPAGAAAPDDTVSEGAGPGGSESSVAESVAEPGAVAPVEPVAEGEKDGERGAHPVPVDGPETATVAEPDDEAPEPAVAGTATAGGAAPRRRFSAAGAVIGLLIGLLGFALVVQVRSNTRDAQLENARQDDLVRILSDLNARETRLRTQISQLEQLQAQLRSGVQGREAALVEARRRADELGILAGTLPAEGTGLRIQFVAGEGKAIRGPTVLEAVEELRGAGAEAMQIGGANGMSVRIVAPTYFVDAADGALNAGGTILTAPFTLTVIGPAQTMRTALTIPGGVADAVQRDGGNVIVEEPGFVLVDALHTSTPLRYAQPVS